jgi:O-succinylbenzoic acid--CoA ligase
MASQIATTPPGAGREALATAGYVLPHRVVEVGPGGTIRVRGRTLFRGYLDATQGEAERLDDPRDAVGWYATGDLGRWDDDGRLVVTGRADDLIITGGENVQPREVEATLEGLPGVVRAVVVGVSSDEFGERPVAFVEMATGQASSDVALEALRETLGEVLPRFKLPDAVYRLPPEALDGLKPDRRYLRTRARALRQSGTNIDVKDS